MRRLLREPLLHFLLLGGAIFVVYLMISKPAPAEPDEIVVTRGTIENLATTFARTWQRPPTAEELDGLIQDYVREEAACRQALSLGLDRDDTIIRRRLRQKLDFISADVAQREPTEADLRAYFETNVERFKSEPTFTFKQVYLNPQLHGEKLDADVRQLLAQLQNLGDQADPGAFGDATLLERRFEAVPLSEVANVFGNVFTTQFVELKPGRWEGPVTSGYGAHLVWISRREEGRVPEFAQVRDAVNREWTNLRRVEAYEAFYRELLRHYRVIIEKADARTNVITATVRP